MARLIGILLLVVVLAVFVALNLPFRTTIDIFGLVIKEAPTVVVMIASVAFGVVLAIAVTLTGNLARRKREALRMRAVAAEQKLNEATRSVPAAPTTAATPPAEAAPPAGIQPATPEEAGHTGGRLRRRLPHRG